MAEIIVVFDFDKTIIEVDSDNWVVDEFGVTDLFNQLLPTMPWNSLMERIRNFQDRMMKEIHEQGKSIEDIKEVLKRVPLHPRIVPAIKKAHALGCDLRIVSDANTLFIDTIVDHLGIKDCFSEINTNPSNVDEQGRLRISPYIDFEKSPHSCKLCPPNMCKGMIIERIQASMAMEGKKRIIYLGDGIGDFCPCLNQLTEGNFMMPRKNFPVWDLICENRALLRAEIHEWIDGEEMEEILPKLIEKIDIQESTNSNSSVQLLVDCKFENVPITPLPSVKVHQ